MKQLHQQVSGVSVTVFCVVNLTHFFSHVDFVPSNVFAPVIMLGTTGLVACLLAALGCYAAMEGNTCRLYTVCEPKY
jgi:hypothetical protein